MISIALHHQLGDMALDLDVAIPSKGITAIFGRSGSGKTSLVNAIAGLIKPQSGHIQVLDKLLFDSSKGIDVPIEKRDIGYVFQDARLFPHYSVKGNLLYGVKGEIDELQFTRILQLLHLEQLLGRYPADLSGGEKQRVAIARALLSSPKVLLMDEPLASLDLPRKKEVMPFLESLATEINIPILYVTHSLNEILRLADHLLLIEQGRVVANGTLEEVWRSSAMKPWQSFSERSSLFEAEILQHHERYALTQVKIEHGVSLWVQKTEGAPGAKARLQIRANDVSIVLDKPSRTSIRNIIPATIRDIESHVTSHGNQSVAVVLALDGGGLLEATITQWALEELGLSLGDKVFAQVKGVSVSQKDIALKALH